MDSGGFFTSGDLTFGKNRKNVDRILAAPERWPAGPYGTRKFLLHRFPFAVVYRELPSAIQVLAVAHGHRRPGYWKTRI